MTTKKTKTTKKTEPAKPKIDFTDVELSVTFTDEQHSAVSLAIDFVRSYTARRLDAADPVGSPYDDRRTLAELTSIGGLFEVDSDNNTIIAPRKVLWRLSAIIRRAQSRCVRRIVECEGFEDVNGYYTEVSHLQGALDALLLRLVGHADGP